MTACCFHCGQPLPPAPLQLTIDGAPRAFCCAGCHHAACLIEDSGLADYYRLREQDAARVDPELLADDLRIWDRPDLLDEHARRIGEAREITVLTDAMRCAACAWLIDHALRGVDGLDEVQANAITGRIRLRWQPARTRLSTLLARLAALGYRVHLAPGAAQEAARLAERRTMILRLGIAGLGTLQAMMFAEALYLDFDNQMPDATRDFFRWIAFLLSTPVVFFSGWPFIAGMLRELGAWRARAQGLPRLGMDTLIASSVLLAYGASLVETIRGGAHVWFDAAVMFVFFLLAARAIEQFARRRASAVIDQLGRARPAFVQRLRADGGIEAVPLAALAVGDRVQVAAGASVPADGALLDAGEFDEALLTGESRPVAHAVGERVLAGSVCLGRPVRMTVAATGMQTRLSELVQLVERAQGARPQLAEHAEALSSHFVLALFAVAAGVFAVWWQVAPERAFEVMLAVLVVSCPCALSLAIPAGLAVAHGALARIGVLSVSADAIDRLAGIDTVLLDKTGTLSAGRPRIVALQAFAGIRGEEARRLAAALEVASGHPLAAAFVDPAAPAPSARAVRIEPGLGVEGWVDGRRLRIGRADFACAGTDDGAVWLGDGRSALARFDVADPLREDALAAVRALAQRGLRVEIASGDGEAAVARVAAALGIEHWRARLSPEDKLAHLRALQARGHRVAMVGDGINDAPVLAAADVSIAMAAGASLAHRAADLVLAGTRLDRLPQSIAIARRTRRVLRQNLGWALAYNLVALPFAALGLVTPWLAAIGMAGSSLLVTANALRLGRGVPVATPERNDTPSRSAPRPTQRPAEARR